MSDSYRSRRAVLAGSIVTLTSGCLRLTEDTATESGVTDSEGSGSQSDDSVEGEDPSGGTPVASGESDSTSNGIEVLSTTGTINNDEDAINIVNLTIGRAPGSGDIDLTELAVTFITDENNASLVHASKGDFNLPEAFYYIEAVQAESPSDPLLTTDTDRYRLRIPLGSAEFNAEAELANNDPADGTVNMESDVLTPLPEGTTGSVTLVPVGGVETMTNLVVPDTLADSDAVRL